jgi:hypothetical protein
MLSEFHVLPGFHKPFAGRSSSHSGGHSMDTGSNHDSVMDPASMVLDPNLATSLEAANSAVRHAVTIGITWVVATRKDVVNKVDHIVNVYPSRAIGIA